MDAAALHDQLIEFRRHLLAVAGNLGVVGLDSPGITIRSNIKNRLDPVIEELKEMADA